MMDSKIAKIREFIEIVTHSQTYEHICHIVSYYIGIILIFGYNAYDSVASTATDLFGSLDPVSLECVKYYIVYLFPVLWYVGSLLGDLGFVLVLGLWLIVIPLLELLECLNDRLKSTIEPSEIRNDWRFSIILWLWVPIQLALLSRAYSLMSFYSYSVLGFLLMTIATGMVTALGINISHELMHRSNVIEKCMSQLLLTTVCYGHYYIQHLYCHHRNVGTDKDPSSAYRGEDVYSFIVRSVIGSYQQSNDVAAQWSSQGSLGDSRVIKQIANNVVSDDVRTKVTKGVDALLLFNTATGLYVGAVLLQYGWLSALLCISQSCVAIFLLELVNYIEHYGLRRLDHQTVGYQHSWNSNVTFSNYTSLNLQRHSNHHCDSTRPYQSLSHIEDTPMLPTGYAGCTLLALIPPLWMQIMHPRLDRLNKVLKVE